MAPCRARASASARIGVWLSAWALAACTCEAVGGIYPTVETIRLDRNVTCNFGPLRQVGWSVDVCNGRFNVSLVKEEMLELHRKGELTQQTQYNVSDEWLAASLDRCRQPGQETGNYIICSKDLLGMGPYNGESVCTNRVIPAKNVDGHQTGSIFMDQVGNKPHGCAVTCDCCGVRCNEMQLFTMPSRSVGPNTSLVLFLHPYSGDSSWAASMFHLNHLVEQHDVIVLAPNGREDDLGLSYWLGGDSFAGHFLGKASDGSESPEMIQKYLADYRMQHELTEQGQYEILARHNFDVRYITEVLSYARRKFPMISTNRTFVFGSGLGADMALLLACNMSEAFGAVISHNGKGLVNHMEQYCQPRRPIRVLLFQQAHEKPSKTSLTNLRSDDLAQYWASVNGCAYTQGYGTPGRLQLLLGPDGNPMVSSTSGAKLHDTEVWNIDYAGCKEGGQVTLWRTTRNNNGLLDSASFPTAVWEWLTEKPQVMQMSAILRNRGHSPGARVGFVVLLSTLSLVVLAIVMHVWVRGKPRDPSGHHTAVQSTATEMSAVPGSYGSFSRSGGGGSNSGKSWSPWSREAPATELVTSLGPTPLDSPRFGAKALRNRSMLNNSEMKNSGAMRMIDVEVLPLAGRLGDEFLGAAEARDLEVQIEENDDELRLGMAEDNQPLTDARRFRSMVKGLASQYAEQADEPAEEVERGRSRGRSKSRTRERQPLTPASRSRDPGERTRRGRSATRNVDPEAERWASVGPSASPRFT